MSSNSIVDGSWLRQLQQLGGVNGVGQPGSRPPNGLLPAGTDRDGDQDGSGVGLVSALSQALSQIGINLTGTTPSTTVGSSATGDGSSGGTMSGIADALKAFMHDLFKALHAQAADGSQGSQDVDGAGGRPARPNIQTRLDGLMQALASGNRTTSGGSSLSALQASFDNLLQSAGVSGGQTSLQDFLKALAGDLPSNPSQGNLVNVSA